MKFLGTLNKVVIFTWITILSTISLAQENYQVPYYGEVFYSQLKSGTRNDELLTQLKTVLRSAHVPTPNNQPDVLFKEGCSGQTRCYQQTSLGYDKARTVLLGGFYLKKDGNSYALKDVYCDKERPASDFPSDAPAPGVIPDGTIVNTEHTWPQSRFTGKFSTEMQKSDMHHLFPTDSQLNSIRGSFRFGEVTKDQKVLKCPESRFGVNGQSKGYVFQPPKNHRGNAARAIFYFSVRYDLPIDPNEEFFLRQWHKEDPVDDEEMQRNEEIYKLQRNRNPFIDHPELVDLISNF